jgi:membrane dipeptidase
MGLLRPPVLVATPRKVPIVDLHVDLSYQHNYQKQPFAVGSGEVPAAALQRGGVIGLVLPLYIPRDVSASGPRLADLESSYTSLFDALVKIPPYRLPGCTKQERSVSTWLAFEGAAPLAEHPDQLPLWVARGVRLFGLVHSYNNSLAGSSGEPLAKQRGLTWLGRRLVRRIHQLGGVVDVSHASDRATDEIIALAKAANMPVVASHSNARALAPHPRNLSDAQIAGIAETNGVIGLNLHQRFLAPRGSTASISDFVRQVRHVKRLVGARHIAIGTDFEGGIVPLPGLEDVSKLQRLAEALRTDGLDEPTIQQIFYKNALRILCPSR